jgi:uncharacterized membrane protein
MAPTSYYMCLAIEGFCALWAIVFVFVGVLLGRNDAFAGNDKFSRQRFVIESAKISLAALIGALLAVVLAGCLVAAILALATLYDRLTFAATSHCRNKPSVRT